MRVGFERTLVVLLDTTNALAGCKVFEPGYDVGASPRDTSSAVLDGDEWQSHGFAKTHDVRQRLFEKQFRTCVEAIPLPMGPGDAGTSGAFCVAAEEASFLGNPSILFKTDRDLAECSVEHIRL